MKPNPNNPGEYKGSPPDNHSVTCIQYNNNAAMFDAKHYGMASPTCNCWCHSSAPKDTQTIPCIKRNGYCPHCGVTHKDTQSTNRIRLCLKDNGVGNPTHAKMVDIPAPPPTGAQEWEKEFDEKWLLYMGDCKCNKEAFFKPFIRTQITAAEERGKAYWEPSDYHKDVWRKEGAAEHHKRVVEILSDHYWDTFQDDKSLIMAHIIAALTTIDPEKK